MFFTKLFYSHEDVFLPYEEVNRRKISKDLVHDNKEYDADPKKTNREFQILKTTASNSYRH